MIDDDDLLTDIAAPASDSAAKAPAGGLWVRSPCLNSVEFRLLGEMRREPALNNDHEVQFIEEGDGEDLPQERPAPTEIDRIRAKLERYYITRLAIARSLGQACTEESYRAKLKQEGLT